MPKGKKIWRGHIHDDLTPWRRVHEALIVAQLFDKYPTFYGTRSFIIVFTRARHWFLFWARRIQSTASHPISLRSTLILSFHLRLGLLSGLFEIYGRKFCTFLISPMLTTCSTQLILFDLITLMLFVKSSMYELHHYAVFSRLPPFLRLRSTYYPEHPVLRHLQAILFF
jgi:hypothetical protein